MLKNDGLIRKSDLENYKVNITQPIKTTYRDKQIFAMGAPSGGGVVILTALNVLENFQLSGLAPNSARTYHLLSETLKYGHQNRSKLVGDPGYLMFLMTCYCTKKLDKRKGKENQSNFCNKP